MEQPKSSPITLPCPAEKLMPHRPPMLFIDHLIQRTGDEAATLATIRNKGIYFDPERGLIPECLVEFMAQTMAAANGYDAVVAGKSPRNGFLVGLDKVRILKDATAGDTLQIEIRKTYEFGPVKILEGQVFLDGTLIAQGEVKVWEEPEAEEKR